MLLLGREAVANTPRIVNVASVPQRSPFRYPGGKTWLVPYFRNWVKSLPERPHILVEPFAGGGIISLTAVMERLVDRALMVELDPDIAAVWHVILSPQHELLQARILSFEMTREAAVAELARVPSGTLDKAFQTLLRNRVQRGGILAPGAGLVKNGENGRGVASRWYPRTLVKRIQSIGQVRDRIEFLHADGTGVIPQWLSRRDAAFFVDPPYTAGGKRAGRRLYAYSSLDHARLFAMLARAAGPVMLTYDDAPEPRYLAERYAFRVDVVPMSSTHHATMSELVITSRNRDCPPHAES